MMALAQPEQHEAALIAALEQRATQGDADAIAALERLAAGDLPDRRLVEALGTHEAIMRRMRSARKDLIAIESKANALLAELHRVRGRFEDSKADVNRWCELAEESARAVAKIKDTIAAERARGGAPRCGCRLGPGYSLVPCPLHEVSP
jgi:hypothetical protein